MTDKLTFRRKFSKHAQNKEIRYAVTSQNIPIFGFELIFLKEVRSRLEVFKSFIDFQLRRWKFLKIARKNS